MKVGRGLVRISRQERQQEQRQSKIAGQAGVGGPLRLGSEKVLGDQNR